tara:strand:- start:155 stop:1072 length:918 start_codon:yes stop_codon:yes gene_type:complete
MKKLYTFTIDREDLVKETETTKNDKGEEVTTTKEVKKTVTKNHFLRKPTRKLFDEAELYYGIKLAEGIKAGLLTRALLQKRFSNDGGVLGDKEKEEWGDLYSEMFDKQVELQALSLKTREQRTPEESVKYEDAKMFIKDTRLRIQEFEMQQSALYDQTAENRARNKAILWWVLFLSYHKDSDDKEVPFFGEGDFEERIGIYDRLEEQEEAHIMETINKFFYYVSFWYVSKTSDPQQFKDLIKFAEQEDLEEGKTEVTFDEEGGEVPVEESPSEEEAQAEEVQEEIQEEEQEEEEVPVDDPEPEKE